MARAKTDLIVFGIWIDGRLAVQRLPDKEGSEGGRERGRNGGRERTGWVDGRWLTHLADARG